MSLPSLRRTPVFAARGAVATTQPLAASAGLDVLRRGGNAVDAAVATAAAMTVVEPGSNDVGGDLFAIVWDGTRLTGLNASGRSPAALTSDQLPAGGMPERGWLPVTVPGAPAGWADLHARFGRLPFADLLVDAVALAEGGYPVAPTLARQWARSAAVYARLVGPEFAAWADVFAPTPPAGTQFRNPDLARTLRMIAETAARTCYTGEVAQALVAAAAATGGLLSAADLAGHENLWVDPVAVRYRGHEVWELPPNGQGLAALSALAILDGLDLPPADVEVRAHRQIEAMKLGFADAHAFVADPELAPAPLTGLLDPDYLAARRSLIGESAGLPAAGEPSRGGTIYLCTADRDGMMVSLIQSTYLGFGSFVVVPGYGFGLQNRGCGFSPDPDHPNAVGPARRPYHTIIPGFLTRDGEPVGPFGVMGGHMQPQGHLQLLSATLDLGLDPQAALDAPRWYWERGRQVLVEPELGPDVIAGLVRRGHEISILDDRSVVGRGQAIWRSRYGGYVAGTEPRADGVVAAY